MKSIHCVMGSRVAAILAAALTACGGGSDNLVNGSPDPKVANAKAAESSVQDQINEVLHRHPNAKQISNHEISWNDGAVILTIPSDEDMLPSKEDLAGRPAAASEPVEPLATVHGCPSGWYCFYQHRDFKGRRVQFRDCTSDGKVQLLSDHEFQNETSSWVVNRRLKYVDVRDYDPSPRFPRGRPLWEEAAYSQSSWVGREWNDSADWFICFE